MLESKTLRCRIHVSSEFQATEAELETLRISELRQWSSRSILLFYS